MKLQALLKMYETRVKKLTVDSVHGTIVHEWHGSFVNRKYRERWDILTKNKYDPFEDIGYTDQGLLQLTDKGRRLEKFLEEFEIIRLISPGGRTSGFSVIFTFRNSISGYFTNNSLYVGTNSTHGLHHLA
jgi:hypothetical protein